MNERWEVVLHRAAARAFFNCRGSERLRLEQSLDSLADNPNQEYRTEIKDPTGRINRVCKVGRWSVVYWLDPFVKEVRIVSLERDA